MESFSSLARYPCLVLLGEPGTGKSHTVREEYVVASHEIAGGGGRSLFVDLQSYGDESRLVADIFGDPTWISWSEGEGRLVLFLDSLDECLLNIKTVASLLKDKFAKCPADRLDLRITCRTADWPSILEDGLRETWGKDEVGVFELARLRHKDVRRAAELERIQDPDRFMAEVWRREAVPLAAKPVTLKMLLNIYRRDGRFPRTQAELYLEGCRVLCEEFSPSRLASGNVGDLTAEQRMAVAARIAALAVFANRSVVQTEPDRGDALEEDVSLRALVGGEESVDGGRFPVTKAAVQETLSTALFSSRGRGRLGWAHKTYAEFLAAHYLTRRATPAPKIMSLVAHPGDPEGKLVPQLHETAAWLAGMVPEVFESVMRSDTEVLLGSDVSATKERARADLVRTLLAKYDAGELLDGWGSMRNYEALDHPGLGAQLRPYICDRSKDLSARRVAMRIAEACLATELLEALVDVALDPSESMEIRPHAAAAAAEMGGSAAARLKPLVKGDGEGDLKDWLKGEGLRAVWPSHITAEELFSVLTPPKRPHYGGAYSGFVSRELAEHLRPEDLPVALKWVESREFRYGPHHSFGRLTDKIMLKAWDHLEFPGVIGPFVSAAIARLRRHDDIFVSEEDDFGDRPTKPFKEVIYARDDRRRLLVETALPMLRDTKDALDLLLHTGTPLVLSKDVSWMLERLQTTTAGPDRFLLANLVERVFDWQDPDQFSTVVEAAAQIPELRQVTAWHTDPVLLSSPEAQRAKAAYYESEERRNRSKQRKLLDPPPAQVIAELLDDFEAGDLDSWWTINRELTLEPDSTHFNLAKEDEPNLTSQPGWLAADDETRARMLEAAEKYVLRHEPDMDRWLKDENLRPVLAGYRAFRLLSEEKPDRFAAIPPETWRKWAPIFLTYPSSDGPREDERHEQLLKTAYRHAADGIIETVLYEIDRDDENGRGYLSAVRKIEGLWDDRLAQALLKKARDRKLKDASVGTLLAVLMKHDLVEARILAISFLEPPLPRTREGREKAVTAAQVLVGHAEDAGWSSVWPRMQEDAAFGRDVVSAVIAHHERRALWRKLSEDQLATLFVWLSRQYPQAEDPHVEGVHTPELRERVARWRDSILGHLTELGTRRSCDAVRRIIREMPDLDGLKWTLQRAEDTARRLTWNPPRPREVFLHATEPRKGLVQNEAQLLDVIIASLETLQKKLQGKTYAAVHLWDRVAPKKFRPVDENRLSDFVKWHLEEDLGNRGVVINREVEIRQGIGTGRGERTDIQVDAVLKSPRDEEYEVVTVTIETKGCWHRDLSNAAETQLAGRYLKDNPSPYGIYLVGWFACDQWDGRDSRKRRTPKIGLGEAQERFDAQAAELSRSGAQVRAFVLNTALR